MCRDFLADVDLPENTEGDVSSFTEKFAVVITVVLSWDPSGNRKRRTKCAYIYKSGWTQEQVVLLHGFRVNDTEIPPYVAAS